MRKINLLFLCFIFVFAAKAQDSLTLKVFLESVYQNHPLFNSAEQNIDIAAGKLRSARGNFDPKIQYNSTEKTFNGSDYFNHNLVQLKVPIYSGIELKTGYELNTGKYLNPEMTTPAEGLLFTEISAPLLKGLLLNQGRAEVMIQQALFEQSLFEWQLAQNDLVYLISSAYWEYQSANELLLLYQNAVEVAKNRLSFVKRTSALGKYATIDTVEAYMEWQRRLSLLNEKRAAFNYTSYALSNQYWLNDSLQRVNFTPSWTHVVATDSLTALTNNMKVSRHPAIRQIDQKITAATIDKNLQKQNLLPELTLRYKPLATGGESMQYSSENFTWGATFQMPLFFRKETGKLKAADGKLDQLQYDRLFKVKSLSNDISAYQEAMFNWQEAVKAQKKNVKAAKRMLEAEKRKLELGSATIFMVNYRERYLLESQEKLIKAQKEFNKAQSAYLNKLGVDVLAL